jgi:transposase
MSHTDPIINLPGFKIERVEGRTKVFFHVSYAAEANCPHCGSSRFIVHQTKLRTIRHVSIGIRLSFLKISAHKFKCKTCRKTWWQRFNGILPFQRSSEAFKEEVFQKHHAGIAQSVLEKSLRLGHSTIERWYHYSLSRLYYERMNNPSPRVLGIDEHFFTAKQGYETTLANLESHKIYDVLPGKAMSTIKPYLLRIPERDCTKVAVMDLSETYRSIVKKFFPNAVIVTDRFHVIHHINRMFMKAWKEMDPVGTDSRGRRSLMRYHEWNLNEGQKKDLHAYLANHPALLATYEFKQKLCSLLIIKHQTVRGCRKLIPELLSLLGELKKIPFKALATLGKTLWRWRDEIARMWRYTKSNGITEGLHTKIEMIQRRAYGFTNFKNYRLRVRALCG